jgi:arsenite/tail-anchored protein-transporting ATPase
VPWLVPEVRGVPRLRGFFAAARALERRPAEPQPSSAVSLPPQVESPPPLPAPGLELLIFAGKGGVGKTTLACATAVRLAREQPGREILLFSTDPAHSVGDCLSVAVGPTPVRVMDGLSALELDAEAEFEKLKQEYRRELDEFMGAVLHGFDVPFDRQVMERMLDLSPPGLDEIMALAKAMDLAAGGTYGRLVLDSAPTGHLVRLLELPEMIDQWLKAFFELFLKYKEVFRAPRVAARMVDLSKQLKRFRRKLADPAAAALYGVSILTEVALDETGDLAASCARLHVAMPVLFLNLVSPPAERDCPSCAERTRAEDELRRRSAAVAPGAHLAFVHRQQEPRGLERLEALGRALYVRS